MFKNITLEMSLKPFKKTDTAYIEGVCEKVFHVAAAYSECAVVSVMLWAADGSEILDYRGNMEDSFEWCYFIGGANPREKWDKKIDPERLGLHSRNYLYMENPPEMTYAVLKEIVSAIKRKGREAFADKQILVGATFDPGPEFAVSDFKYNRHNEICSGADMGENTMVCAYEKLNGDHVPYAGFPGRHPGWTAVRHFFRTATNIFLRDIGFVTYGCPMAWAWPGNLVGCGRDL